MDREQILETLRALGVLLAERGLRGEMYVVGGAAIALAYDERRSTRDIDAVFEPKMEIYAAAAELADRLGLPPGWLNDAVKGFLGGTDPNASPVLDVPGLRCLAASPRVLLALKMLAHRVGEDEADVLLLAMRSAWRPARRFWAWPRRSSATGSIRPPGSSWTSSSPERSRRSRTSS